MPCVRILPTTLVVAAVLTASCGGSSGGGTRIGCVFELGSATFTITEDDGTVTIPVHRVGNRQTDVAVDYATSEGTATSPEDYVTASGTLTWPAGDDTDRTISVSVIDDLENEGDETVIIALSGPTGGASLGSIRTAILTIIDDDFSGSPDIGFGTAGAITSDGPQPGAFDLPHDIAVDGSFLYIVGYDSTPPAGTDEWRIEKRSALDGSLDAGFGVGGVIQEDFTAADESARGIAIDSTHMYVVGFDADPGDLRWRIEKRLLADGTLDAGFGTGGAVTSNPSPARDGACDVATDGTHMYVSGFDSAAASFFHQWRLEKRSLVDGTMDSAFGTGGVITSDPSGSNDEPTGIAVDSTSIYWVGWSAQGPYVGWRVEKRSLLDGAPDTLFGPGGAISHNPSPSLDEYPRDVAVDGTHLYVAGMDRLSGDRQVRVEKRAISDGLLDPGFGAGGIYHYNPSAGTDEAWGIAVDGPSLYVVGFDCTPGGADQQWFVSKQSAIDGTLVPSFGIAGIAASNPSPDSDNAREIALGADHIFIVGFDSIPAPFDYEWRVEKRWK